MSLCTSRVSCIACAVILVLFCAAAGCSSYQAPASAPATQSPPSAPGGNTVRMTNFAFNPPALTVTPGMTVTWVNQDAAPHTVVSDAGSPESFSSDSIPTGGSYTHTFTVPGSYSYHCSIHPSMKGSVTVQG